ncbi:hypothetical protein GPEL0_01f1052 [Geoanaerobacter pelophilus]|uniref:Uncharacterized protein n=1 Tax=Geoanaerobacter pelophilus TaxID=60036 RepID=A0ABQ0MFR2_9BACT|nr:hypothetical protein [Geoanaerobacter pelophilus]GAW65931.1 hypothetical protein GPEL0_01f1052 [Geoanaerobacter pelophilus]
MNSIEIIRSFEVTDLFTDQVKQDALAILKTLTAQVVFRQTGAFDTLNADLSAKYADQPETRQYLKATAIDYCDTLTTYVEATLERLQVQEGANVQ